MKTPSLDWLVREWRHAKTIDSKLIWRDLWFQLMGARRLALDLGLHDLEDDLCMISSIADAFGRECRA